MQMREIPFSDLLSHIADNRGRTCPTATSGRPLIATNCISNTGLYPSYETERYVSNETYRTWFRAHPLPGDIIFVCKGSPGRVAFAPDPVDFCIAQDMVAVRADESRVYPKYLFAVLRSQVVQNRINNMHVGTLIPHFKKGDFDKLQIPLPDRSAQELIGDTYFELSEKIEQNRRTGRASEELAQATFKAWFVDFGPVKAKAAGQTSFPGLSAAAFAAMPDRLTDSPLYPVPAGWECRSLYSVARFINGAPFKSSHFSEPPDGLPVVKIAELKSGITDQTKYSNRTDLDARYRINTGDMLYSWSGSPDTSLDTFLWTKGPGLLNQHIFRIVTESDAQKIFVYYLLKHLKQDLIEIARDKQTTGLGHVTVGDMQRLMVAWPDTQTLAAFHEMVGPQFALSFNGRLESERLTALRDYLLPQLLSGLVPISNVELPTKEAP